jgi:dienelactone hydrolase
LDCASTHLHKQVAPELVVKRWEAFMNAESAVVNATEQKQNVRTRIQYRGRALRHWGSQLWTDIRPGREARRGGIWGSVAAAFLWAIVFGYYLKTGFGLWFDLCFSLISGALIILISILLVPLFLTILRKLPRLASGMIFGCFIFILVGLSPAGILVAPFTCLFGALLGATIASSIRGHFVLAATRKKIVIVVLFTLALAGAAGHIVFLSNDSSTEELRRAQLKSPVPEPLSALNPGAPGPFKTRVVYYGTTSSNPRRPEYNNAAIPTRSVDASKFFQGFKGWKRNLRKKYWGYDFDKLPLNATVWLPQGPGPFPLAIIVHGNHNMAEFSDPGYQYLGELLASRGFILVSVDENFLNGWMVNAPKEFAVRGWMLLEHLKLWHEWSQAPKNPFGVAVDFNNIAVMGHSRGGEAAATAALFNQMSHYPDDATIRFHYHFPIRSVVAIAPADGQYKPADQPRSIQDVNYFVIQGANDSDVSSFFGSKQWDRVRYTSGGDWFKSELYVYGANHGQFNTVWGRSDFGYPLGWFLQLKQLMDPKDQRQIAGIYISAFLESTLHGHREYLPLFRDYRTISKWLPDTAYISRYEDAAFKLVSDFSEDPDVSTTTLPGGKIEASDLSLWKEARIPFRNGDREYNGVFLGWNRKDEKGNEDPKIKPEYVITLPEQTASAWSLANTSALVLSVAALDEAPPLLNGKEPQPNGEKNESGKERESPDFTLEFQTADGVRGAQPLSRFGEIPAPRKVRFTKLQFLDNGEYKKAAEPVFQTITVPLSSVSGVKGFDARKLRTIRLRFDLTPASEILISKIGFE